MPTLRELSEVEYKMGTGGGEPIPAGKKMTTEKRVKQPKSKKTGRFLSNNAAEMPTKYPGRGKTNEGFDKFRIIYAKKSKKAYLADENDNLYDLPKEYQLKSAQEIYDAVNRWSPSTGKYGEDILDVEVKKKGGKLPKEGIEMVRDAVGKVETVWKYYKNSGIPTYANYQSKAKEWFKAKKDWHFKDIPGRTWNDNDIRGLNFNVNKDKMEGLLDSEMANQDPDAFKTKNKFAINYVLETVNKNKPEDEKWTEDHILQAAQSGLISSFKELNDLVEKGID